MTTFDTTVSAANGATFRRLPNGTAMIENLKVFKAGSFKDSKGIKRTWAAEHLEHMVQNFETLKNSRIFADVPVRADHSASVHGVGGYFDSVRTDGQFIYANLLITEPNVADKYERGTWRGRSLEVGAYETNDEAVYWPTIMGVAFVDIPAVEGLHSQSKSEKVLATYSQTLQDDDFKEPGMTEEERIAAQKAADEKAAADKKAADEAAAKEAADKEAADKAATEKAAADKKAADDAAALAAANHSAGGNPLTFRVNGADTTDFGAVQRHITALETTVQETGKQARTDFVKGLSDSKRIVATQVNSLTALALTMNDSQFSAFRDSYKDAAPAALFEKQGDSNTGTPPDDPKADHKADLEETVAMFRRAGMADEKIEKTEAYKNLQKLNSGAAV